MPAEMTTKTGDRTRSAGYVGVCDGFRVISIGIIAWFHIWQQSWLWPGLRLFGMEINLDPLIRSGYMWVDLMILISGFCLYLPWSRLSKSDPSPDAGAFYKRRAARILPSYLLSVVVTFCAAYASGFYLNPGRALKDLLTHMTFTHVFFYETYYATPINAALWTIAVEVHFYLLFPIFARAFRRLPCTTCMVMIALALAFRAWTSKHVQDTGIWFNQMLAYLDTFAIGMLAAQLHTWIETHVRANLLVRILFTVGAILAFLMLLRLGKEQSRCASVDEIRLGQMERRLWVSLFGAISLVCSAHSAWGLRKLLDNRITHFLAGISMQFYIWHQVTAVQILRAGLIPSAVPDPNYNGDLAWQRTYTAVIVIAVLILSTVLTYGFERPIVRRLGKQNA